MGPRSGRRRLAFDALAGLVLGVVVSAWAVSIVAAYRERQDPPAARPAMGGRLAMAGRPAMVPPAAAPALATSVARTLGASLTDPRSASTAYLDDATLRGAIAEMRGQSGKLRAVIRAPNADLAEEADTKVSATYEGEQGQEVTTAKLAAPADPGIYKLAVQLGKISRPVEDLRVITMVPFAEKKNDRIGLYYLGSWPYENGGKPRTASYSNPSGFIEVTRENRSTAVSEHFKLGDFLTKDQYDVWPKYLLLEPKLLDKLELTVAELEKEGHHVDHVFVMSGFRTPRYNKGGGNTGGRANLSRHMYGDASDVYVDNDRDGQPDDLNGDGKVDTKDAKVFADAAEKVERQYPALVGGIGIYKACCGHGPFTHIDTRGYRARWYGEGAG
ncbi:MAG TPA: hypothetical protein VGQ33_23970 [Vicinamibacteria bacterium]|nr:hypothetical protein [Vicinamibacteria bacterium]